MRTEPAQLRDVECRKVAQAPPALGGEPHPYHSLVGDIDPPDHESAGFGAVDEPHGTVVTQQQLVCQLTHARLGVTTSGPHRQEELVLCWRDPRLGRPLLRPVQVAAQLVPKRRQPPVVRVGQTSPGWRIHIVPRY